ncbi:MAG: gephyrin-like molybdotransferase Glp [Myxococcota bacterium]|nr:gephyrin-like molybdotransferase Glp [Myxococcota bacterium]
MLSVRDAQQIILEKVSPLDAENAPLGLLLGRTLADDFRARRALPPWDNSAMDGYAVRVLDVPRVPTVLPVIDQIAAGDSRSLTLPPGSAMRIFTGAPMPNGADAVVLQEDTSLSASGVEIKDQPMMMQHIRRAGSDIAHGAPVLPKGRMLTPGDISLLASQGCTAVSVVRRPRVAVMATGSELASPDQDMLARGQIVDGNTPALLAAVSDAGAIARQLPATPDALDQTIGAIEAATRGVDVLLTTGGVSVGDHDHVRTALRQLSGEDFGFWKVAIKPGKPIVFARIGRCLCFGLPGNPVSALVTFEVFVRPALRRLAGLDAIFPRTISVPLSADIGPGGRRAEYRRCRLSRTASGLLAVPAMTQSSGALSSIAGQDGLMVIPTLHPARRAGESVEVIPLGRPPAIFLEDRSKLDYGHDLSEDISGP